ncbi:MULTISPECIES: ricin-type beta-trefoil lectin domain protein [unclassified Xanthomonas]|uniref:ricin-type beta-trefoil lectin domain protein n=1 Tax=Xanthomonas sp. LMG 8992 TaxID=1591157 RepID=UPI0017F69534|nr:ricin-type beta-trefoil lectin domain protein [Xanthomonas sp. LMG 8992]
MAEITTGESTMRIAKAMGWSVAALLCTGLSACGGAIDHKHSATSDDKHASAAATTALPMAAAQPASLFDAKDSGALIRYTSRTPTGHDGAFALYPITLSEAHAIKASVDGTMTVPTPDGKNLRITYQSRRDAKRGIWTWVGRVDGQPMGNETVISFGRDAVFGSLGTIDGMTYQLTTIDGVPYIMAATSADLHSAGSRADGRRLAESVTQLPAGNTAQGYIAGYSSLAQVNAQAGTTSTNTIDVLLGYTPGYRDYRGGASAIETVLTNLVETANQSFANANINVRYRLVGTVQVDYPDNTPNDGTLNELTGVGQATAAALVPLHDARDRFGADLVGLVRRFNNSQQSCGVAWQSGGTDSRWGYSVISDGVDGGYYCTRGTLAHEFGHLLGSGHQHETGQEPGFNFGHRSDTGSFHTTMAYAVNGQSEILVYSSPAISTCNGQACGVPDQADNARAFLTTVPNVVQYRQTVVPFDDSSSPGQIMGPSGKCVDVINGETGNGTPIQVWDCNGFRQQKWSFQPGSRSLRGLGTNKVLDVTAVSRANGAPIQLYQSLNTANQAWYFTNASLIATGGKVLDVAAYGTANGAQLQLWDNLSGPNQRWSFNPASGEIRVSTGRCLDVVNFSTAPGTPVQIWDCNGTKNQAWQLGKNGAIVGYGGNCLEVVNTPQNGAAIRMATCTGSNAQAWRIRGQIRSELHGKCLDDSAGGTLNGARVQMWECLGNVNQLWEVQSN